MNSTRRQLITGIGISTAGFAFSACKGGQGVSPREGESSGKAVEDQKGGEVTAAEDLMREHGILRRALLVYLAVASKLRSASTVSPDALQKTANLFRVFGEEYHEKKLEEAYIFPAVRNAGGQVTNLVDVLTAQHQRGREITDYILAVSRRAKLGAGDAETFARALESFVLMYEHHAAREDTIVFPTWKQTLPASQLDEMGEKFEEIEREQFGEDGFEDAARQISEIEQGVGVADIAQFTAPPPPPQ